MLRSPKVLVAPQDCSYSRLSTMERLPVEILDLIVDYFQSENLEQSDKTLHATLRSLRLTCKTFANLRSTLRSYFFCVKVPATSETKSKIESMDMSTILEHAKRVEIILPRLGRRNECLAEIIEQKLPKGFLRDLRSMYCDYDTELAKRATIEVLDSLNAKGTLPSVGELVREGEYLLHSYIFPFTLRFTCLQKLTFSHARYPALYSCFLKDSIKLVKSATEDACYKKSMWPNGVIDRNETLGTVSEYLQAPGPSIGENRTSSETQQLSRMVSNIHVSASPRTNDAAGTASVKMFLLKVGSRNIGLAISWYGNRIALLSMVRAESPVLPVEPSASMVQLKELSITRSTISAPLFAQFLHRCPLLESFFCAGCELEHDNESWRMVFDAVRDHQNRMMVKVDTVTSKGRGSLSIDLRHHTKESVEACDYNPTDEQKRRRYDLARYLTGDGEWTRILEYLFDD